MKRCFNLVALLLFTMLLSCSEKKENKIPDNIISEEKMVGILVDVHMAEAAININPSQIIPGGDSITIIDIYKKNGITKKEFNESIKYYSSQPRNLDKIYEHVIDELNKMQAVGLNAKK